MVKTNLSILTSSCAELPKSQKKWLRYLRVFEAQDMENLIAKIEKLGLEISSFGQEIAPSGETLLKKKRKSKNSNPFTGLQTRKKTQKDFFVLEGGPYFY